MDKAVSVGISVMIARKDGTSVAACLYWQVNEELQRWNGRSAAVTERPC
jgi:hypothetical protein